jgi:hypothetical protein
MRDNKWDCCRDEIYNGGIGFEFPAEYKGGIEKILCF